MTSLYILLILLLLIVLVLVAGIMLMASGKEELNKKYSSKLMTLRVCLQAAVVVTLVVVFMGH